MNPAMQISAGSKERSAFTSDRSYSRAVNALRRQANCRQAEFTGARKPRRIRNIADHAADFGIQIASPDRFVNGYEI